jgi:uncharacterized RDD family membrane protein YckC
VNYLLVKDNHVKGYAGFWQRAGAFALDYIIILFYLVGITLLSLLVNSLFSVSEWLFADRVRAQLTGFLLLTLPVTLYFAVGEASGQQATWGKKRMGLRVTDIHGEPISFWRSLLRTALKFIPWELSHTLIWEIYFSPGISSAWVNYGLILVYVIIGLNIASLMMTRTHQTIYDYFAKTYVIKQA